LIIKLLLPPESIDEVFHILLQEVVNDSQGILIGGAVKIEGSPKKMTGRVGKEKLLGGSCVAAHIKKDTANAVDRLDGDRVNGTGLIGMFVGHLKSVLPQLIETIRTDRPVADINTGVETREIDIYPPGVGWPVLEKRGVFQDIRINGVVETIWITGFVKGLILMHGKADPEITPGLGCVVTIAGEKQAA
jgi:hypothetical protein